MPTINPPTNNPLDDDLECQQALEASFLELSMRLWLLAGRVVSCCIGDLADNLWVDEEQLGPQPELPAVGHFDP